MSGKRNEPQEGHDMGLQIGIETQEKKQQQRCEFLYCMPHIVLGFWFSFIMTRECMNIKTSSLNNGGS